MLKYFLILCFVSSDYCSFQRLVKKEKISDWQTCPQRHKECKRAYKRKPLDSDETFWCLRAHNFYRNRIALGELTIGGNTHAANMHTLSYDADLQNLAQCRADACTGIVRPDKCSAGNISAGQNTFNWIKSHKINPLETVWIVESIRNWFYEIKHLRKDDNIIDSYKKSENTDNFTQLVWAKSAIVGCGRTYYKGRHRTCLYFTCLYQEAGNIPEQPVYQRGKPCSNCGKENCNDEYQGLCGKIILNTDIDPGQPFASRGNTLLIAKHTMSWILLHNLLILTEGKIVMLVI